MSNEAERRAQNELELRKAQAIVDKSEHLSQIGELKRRIENLEKKRLLLSYGSLAIAIIALLVTIGSVYYGFFLNEPYLIRRDPSLSRIWMTPTNWGKWQLEYTGESTEYAEICLYNEGKAPTGTIELYWDRKLKWLDSVVVRIPNILGNTANCTKIPMRANHLICDEITPGVTQMNCDKERIPSNKTEITLIIDCKYCDVSRITKNMTVCFFDNEVPSDFSQPCE